MSWSVPWAGFTDAPCCMKTIFSISEGSGEDSWLTFARTAAGSLDEAAVVVMVPRGRYLTRYCTHELWVRRLVAKGNK